MNLQAIADQFAFHNLHGYHEAEKIAANTRVFEGDGTPFLRCPGLKTLAAVRVGRTLLPAEIVHEIPTDADMRRLSLLTMPGVSVQHDGHGVPVVCRNVCSNDGMWQKGEAIYVTGEWDADVPAPVPPAEKKRGGRVIMDAGDPEGSAE